MKHSYFFDIGAMGGRPDLLIDSSTPPPPIDEANMTGKSVYTTNTARVTVTTYNENRFVFDVSI